MDSIIISDVRSWQRDGFLVMKTVFLCSRLPRKQNAMLVIQASCLIFLWVQYCLEFLQIIGMYLRTGCGTMRNLKDWNISEYVRIYLAGFTFYWSAFYFGRKHLLNLILLVFASCRESLHIWIHAPIRLYCIFLPDAWRDLPLVPLALSASLCLSRFGYFSNIRINSWMECTMRHVILIASSARAYLSPTWNTWVFVN